MNPKNLKKFNITNLFLNIIIILLASFVLTRFFLRIDLTSEKKYTLTQTTINTLKNLNDDVVIRIYLEGEQLPPGFKRLQNAIKEMIKEYSVYSASRIDFQFINPTDNDDEETKYRIYEQLHRKGILPIELKERTKEGKESQIVIFPGATVIYKGKEMVINFLKNDQTASAESNLNNSIQALEYEFTNAMMKLSNNSKLKIAFTQGHGELNKLQLRDICVNLSEHYDIDFINDLSDVSLLQDYSLLIVAKPLTEYRESEKYVIDQFIMNGGKTFWFIDGVVTNTDSLLANNETLALANDVNLTDLLFKYGARINSHLVEDLQCSPVGLAVPGADGKSQIKLFPWHYFPLIVNPTNHALTKYIGPIKTEFISSIDSVGASPLINKTFLLFSSKYSKITPVPARIDFSMIKNIDESQYNSKPIPVALLLEGVFPSVFKNRPIAKFTSQPKNFVETSIATSMIVVADGDIIKNDVSPKGEIYPLGFDRHSQNTFRGNAEFVSNAVNYLCDNAGLMNIRDRELKLRLLDKDKINKSQTIIQLLNVVLPVVIVIIFGLIFVFIRKKRFQ